MALIVLLFFSVSFRSGLCAKELTVGVLQNWPPRYSIDLETEEPTGFAIEVFEEMAEGLGLDYQYKVFISWPDLTSAFDKHEVDLIPNLGISSERKKHLDFSASFDTFSRNPGILVPA